MDPMLNIRRLTKTFAGGGFGRRKFIRALDGVDFQVFTGETVGLVGESGCGKTTLARCILRLEEATSGTVEFDGQDLSQLNPAALRRKRKEFQIIFQDPASSLDPRMSIERIMLEPFEAHNLGTLSERRERVRELLDIVSLDKDLLSNYPEALSGGQQQRVGIARALALNPKLIIADEPVSALDASVQAQILNLLADLQNRSRLTLILISHSLGVVHYLCSRVVVMYLGRIVEDAPSARFFSGPGHPYSQMLLRSMPDHVETAGSAKSIPAGEIPSPASPPTGCSFHPRCPEAFNRCKRDRPELYRIGEGARAACFLYT